jgi:cell fate regulator YaaT (PSP1 superfamily)
MMCNMSTVPIPTKLMPNDPTKLLVRHGSMRFVGEFQTPPAFSYQRREEVVIVTDRGTELGQLLGPSTPQTIAHIPDPTRGQILRTLTAEDEKRAQDVKVLQNREFEIGCQMVADHRLAMQIIDVEHLFGGERILFYFLADSRVDFRELVKSMAREFHTRIELRQIGVRDEAKLKADYGDCGKPVCCNTFMLVMPPVSMRMAKLQKSTLDPTKISGRCGRLKCCLRFEQDVYEAHQLELPAIGARVLTKQGQGRVLAQEVLARRLLVEFEDGRRLPVPAADILTKL